MVKIGIVGSRRRDTEKDKAKLTEVLISIQLFNSDVTFVSGGCPKGADRFAEELAKKLNLPIIIHYPDKSKLEANTKWAYAKICYARNTLIAEDSDILIACVAPDRKGGTEDTIKKYLTLGKKDLIII